MQDRSFLRKRRFECLEEALNPTRIYTKITVANPACAPDVERAARLAFRRDGDVHIILEDEDHAIDGVSTPGVVVYVQVGRAEIIERRYGSSEERVRIRLVRSLRELAIW